MKVTVECKDVYLQLLIHDSVYVKTRNQTSHTSSKGRASVLYS